MLIRNIAHDFFSFTFFMLFGEDKCFPSPKIEYGINDFHAVKELFADYHERLGKNGHVEMSKLPCYYQKKKTLWQKLDLKK